MARAAAPFLAGLLVRLLLHHRAAAALALFALPPTTTPNINQPGSPLVQSTCSATTFYDLCVAAITANPSSSTADVPGLCAIAVSAAAANASATVSFLANNASSSASEAERVLLRSCAVKYRNAREALLAAGVSVAEAAYDYALVHVSAAVEYPAVCRTLFRRRASYPAELANREEGLRRLCTIVRDIISLLQMQGHS